MPTSPYCIATTTGSIVIYSGSAHNSATQIQDTNSNLYHIVTCQSTGAGTTTNSTTTNVFQTMQVGTTTPVFIANSSQDMFNGLLLLLGVFAFVVLYFLKRVTIT